MLSGLRLRLIVLVLLALAPAFGLIVYTGVEQHQEITRDIQETALRLARLAASDHGQWIAGTRQLLVGLSELPAVRTRDGRECSATFASLIRQHPLYANLGAIDPDGRLFCSALPFEPGLDLADRAYFRRAIATGEFAVGDYQVGRVTGKASINVAYPARDAAGTIRAVAFAAIDLTPLNRFIVEAGLPAGSSLTVVDGNGTILVRHPGGEQWVGKTAQASGLHSTIRALRSGVTDAVDVDGVSRLIGFSPLMGTTAGDVYVSVGVPRSAASAATVRSLLRNLATLGLVTVLVLGVAWVGSDILVLRRINRLVEATARLAAGDLSARIGERSGTGELGRLARAFDELAAALEARNVDLQRIDRARRVLGECNRALVRSTGESQLLRDLCRILVEVGGYALAWVGVAERDRAATVRPVARAGRGADELETVGRAWADSDLGRGATGTALRTGQSVIVRNIAQDPAYAPWREWARRHRLGSTIALPLLVGGSPFGVLRVYATEPDAFNTDEASLLGELAADAAYGVEALGAHAGRALAIAELEKSEERYRLLVEASIQGMLIHRGLVVLFANPAAARMFGFERLEEFVGTGLHELLDPGERDRIANYTEARLRGESAPSRYELQGRRRDGTSIWLEALASVVPWEGRPAVLATMVDVTERKRAEAEAERQREARFAAERLAALGRLAAGVGHELRNPVTVIDARVGLLKTRLAEGGEFARDMMGRYVASLEEASGRMKRILQALSTYAKPSKPEPTRLDVAELLAAAGELLAYDARKAGVTITVEAPGAAYVMADRAQLMQVLVNLATNAVQAMEATGGQLTLRARVDPEGATVRVDVADTGPGIPPDVMAKLGEPFFTTKAEGTGLGLSIVRGIIAEHPGARLSIDSAPGHGATFTIVMPAAG